MSDTHDEVETLLRQHTFWPANHSSIGPEGHCLCGERPRGFPEWTTHVADVITAHLSSWDFLMELLNRHYPADVFPTLPDSPARDPGPRIVSLIRHLDATRSA